MLQTVDQSVSYWMLNLWRIFDETLRFEKRKTDTKELGISIWCIRQTLQDDTCKNILYL